jgi:pimeloyl-ACP methyl ester carboxylesterase
VIPETCSTRTFWVELPSATLHVYEWGEAGQPAVLYWDGLGGTGLHANEIAQVLVGEFALRVIAPDPPGHGLSPALPPESFRPSALAAVTAELLAALAVERVSFVGFSWGARIGSAFAAAFPELTSRLVLVDGGYFEFADLPSFDPDADLSSYVAASRAAWADECFPNWDAYFAAQRDGLGRWTPALAEAHRAIMREEAGRVVPILTEELDGAITHGSCLEPGVSTHDRLRASGVPVLLVTCAEHGKYGTAGIERLHANVPQLRAERLPGGVHDLVSHAAPELARIVGDFVTT